MHSADQHLEGFNELPSCLGPNVASSDGSCCFHSHSYYFFLRRFLLYRVEMHMQYV